MGRGSQRRGGGLSRMTALLQAAGAVPTSPKELILNASTETQIVLGRPMRGEYVYGQAIDLKLHLIDLLVRYANALR